MYSLPDSCTVMHETENIGGGGAIGAIEVIRAIKVIEAIEVIWVIWVIEVIEAIQAIGPGARPCMSVHVRARKSRYRGEWGQCRLVHERHCSSYCTCAVMRSLRSTPQQEIIPEKT